MSDNIKKMIGQVFNDIADGLETGSFGKKVRVGLTSFGSEHGTENLVKAAELAQSRDSSMEVVLIGPKAETELTQYEVSDEDQGYKKMEELLDAGEIDACVTMHYNFPIGVSTVGRAVTPGFGKEMLIATTTGTSSAHRVEAMVLNGIYGLIVAKALGNQDPSLGILNVDGARQVERAFKQLNDKGFNIKFAESHRADGGDVMRGNDLLQASCDVVVNDSLTGNILMKMFSSFTTGGSYEANGFGYGPGIGEGFNRTILIVSRASGVPVVANALTYAAGLVKGNLHKVAKATFEAANAAGLKDILASLSKANEKKDDGPKEAVAAPPKEVVEEAIAGIDILELEDSVQALWKEGIYAESGMGCTGPVIMVSKNNLDKAKEVLTKAGYITSDANC
ncbi:glycine/sarcosine/betaine reductase complex component C subunit alpha [Fenollaria sporofastidiosus]|uniref:glycine/sarcosine/betaine reductase complex component C subunit alpha n=1 Tax=Fenollaria sporofastidiosus TaxID=2811778 RepID=UPI001C0001CA|nr:glycine/sarcosine/betaine reductase complex component C subunit alpha [Fenollaria sporofastidiosus]